MSAADQSMQASHVIRLTFEQLATWLILSVLFAACFACLIATWPAQWANTVGDHINKIAASLMSFVGTLGGVLGLSWGRGHFDQRLERREEDGHG